MMRFHFASVCFVALVGCMAFSPSSRAQEPNEPQQPSVYEGPVGGLRVIEEGQPPVMIHATTEQMKQFREANPNARHGSVRAASTSNDLFYHGGIGGSSWLNSVTQYCQGVATGTFTCGSSGTHAGNQSNIFVAVWADNASSAPSRPRQSQIAAEAVRAAQHFGNTTAASNASVQYVIATATRNNSRGFGSQYCAYHSATSSAVGNVAYTNLPYMTDAGANCGANFNGLGPDAGITSVGGHEMGETITDQFPNGGWLDSAGAENGDKCAWISSGQGASADISLSTGTFAVQSLWSNAFNNGSGGCVLSYP